MITRPDFAYVQARVQSRHGERPDDPLWQRLHASRGLGHLLEAARSGGLERGGVLERWIEQVSATSDPHAMDRAVRSALRHHVGEVSGWTPTPWRPAVRWTTRLLDLPALERLLGPEPPPPWMGDDPELSPFALEDREARATAMRDAGLGPIVDAVEEGLPARAGWRQRFEALLPTDPGRTSRVRTLVDGIEAHAERMEGDPGLDGWVLRGELAAQLEATLRWNALEPVAVFAHLALTALDLERLRGAVLRRRLFPETRSEVSWV